MKNKIFLLTLLISSFGYAQVLPIDFSDPLDDMFADNCTFNLTTDAGDDVGQIIGSGQLYDNVQLTLAQNIDLSDDTNNTITFRIKPASNYGTRTHLLKFENGTTANTELGFTTTGDVWQNISLDYPAGLGNYELLVLFIDFNNTDVGTYLVDDLAGGTNVAPIPELEEPSPTPTTPNNEVLSIYADTGGFTNVWTSDYEFGVTTVVDTDPTAVINNTLKMDFSVAGYGQGTNPGVVTDVSAYNYFHFDYWTSDATQIRMILIEEDGTVQEYFYELPTQEPFTFNQWKSVDIPLTFFTAQGFSTDKFFQYKIGTLSDLDTGIVYFDNLYFSVNPGTMLSVQDFETTTFNIYPNPAVYSWAIESKGLIRDIQLFDILGNKVDKIISNKEKVSINATNLPSGLYFAKITSSLGAKTVKLIRK